MARRSRDLSPDEWLVPMHVMPRACVTLPRTTIVSGITGGRALGFQNDCISTCGFFVVSPTSPTSANSSCGFILQQSPIPQVTSVPMSLDIPPCALQPTSPAASIRASYESVHPHPTALSPVAQSIEHKSSQMSPIESQHDRELPDPTHDDNQPERPSLNLNRARYSWRSQRSVAHDDREDAKSYRAVSTHDYGAPGRSPSTKREVSNPQHERQRPSARRDFSNPRNDHRYSCYDHPYYNHPYMYPYHGPPPPHPPRDAPPRASWRSSATVGVSPSRASKVVPPPKAPADEPEPSDNESDGEELMIHPAPRQHQRPLTWGYDDRMTPPPPPQEVIMRLPFTEWMNSGLKEHFVATLAEFVGTVMFLFFAFAGTQVANINASNPTAAAASTTPSPEGFSPIVLTYIALSFGFSLMVNVWIFYRISGGLFNPAVTLGMVMVKSLSYTRGFLLVCAQIVGSIVTSLIVKVLFPVDFNVRTTLSPGTSLVQGVFIEGLLTAELVFAIFMLAKEKHRATYLAPIGIGIAMFVAELVGVYYTGGSLNPARSFGPCVVTGIWDSEQWIYWLGKWRRYYFCNFRAMLTFNRTWLWCHRCCGLLQLHQGSRI
jgi:MIP family channel proteins